MEYCNFTGVNKRLYMEPKRTNKTVLARGIKFIAGSLPLMFSGPVILFSSFKNQDHPLFIPVLILALALMLGSMYLIFKGLKIIMQALFD